MNKKVFQRLSVNSFHRNWIYYAQELFSANQTLFSPRDELSEFCIQFEETLDIYEILK